MSTPTNHWKLGLFVVASTLCALAVVIYLGATRLAREHVDYVSYFDESVQGLDVGSVVKFRGVAVGRVAGIDVAPDHRHVAVTMAFSTQELADFRLAAGSGHGTRLVVPPGLRAQLINQGLTGLKLVQLDFFDEQRFPVPILGFAVPERYIPATPSMLKNVENAVVSASDRMPEMLATVAKASEDTARILEQLETQRLPEQLAATLAHFDELVTSLHGAVGELDVRGLSARMNQTLAHANAVLARLDGDKGLVASTARAVDGFGDLAAMSPDLGSDLVDTLKQIRSAASSIQRVADALERDPDMLIKGRKVSR
jgi:phospholipid/cholesterol/gamma-HCH transport system substrate-binding protein